MESMSLVIMFYVSLTGMIAASLIESTGLEMPVTNYTSLVTFTIYPNSRHLESLILSSFVSHHSAIRVSSACSCLSMTPSTSYYIASISTLVPLSRS